MKTQPIQEDGTVTLSQNAWRELGEGMITAAGNRAADASTIMDVLITGGLAGIDSHGVRNIPFFAKAKRKSRVKVIRERAATAILDPGDTWGPVYAVDAMQRTIRKARKYGVACCTVMPGGWVTNLFHYVWMAAKKDMIAMVFVNTPPAGAAWGGIRPVFGTNPIGLAFPAGKSDPIVLDFATTIVSHGQTRSQSLKHKPLSGEWFIDSDGNPVKEQIVAPQDWEKFVTDHALLPFGTYKGWGIAVTTEILGGALNLAGTGTKMRGENGITILAIDVRSFVSLKQYKREVDDYVAQVKSSGVRKGFEDVLMPGEREFRTMEERRRSGIPVDSLSWGEIERSSKDLGIDIHDYLKG